MLLTKTAGAADIGRKIKYFVRGDMRVSYHQFSQLKSSGGLRVNGETVHANYFLREGDVVTVELPELGANKVVLGEDKPITIAYEDEDILILDKSAPLACQCTPKQPEGTLENRVIYHYKHIENFVFRPLNRLDKGTSGLMAVAKHAHACQILQKQLHSEDFIREYEAIVEGVLEGEGWIDLPIGKEQAATVRRVIDHENGLKARTYYRAIFSDGKRTRVRLRLETGRTHQIRVHMAAIGHPLTGDFLYGCECDALPGRFALHSVYISLVHPCSGRQIECTSPLPEAMLSPLALASAVSIPLP